LGKAVTIALDAMGGDDAPAMVVRGADIARQRYRDVRYLLFGDEKRIEPLFARFRKLREICTIRHTEDMVSSDAKPSAALRGGRNSSMRLAINAVAEDEAQGIVSAGNTGALLVMAKFVLKTLPGIDRPAMASYMPTLRGETLVLDLGANVECSAKNLVEFAVMGEAFARATHGLVEPSVGILNVGEEELKGVSAVREAAMILSKSGLPIKFLGFVEGDDIPSGTVDVTVTDGFTGNVALKMAEGTARLYTDFLGRAFRSSWRTRLGYLMARPALKQLRLRMDPRRYNGAVFLGLNGVTVKSHGGTDAFGFANAVGLAVELARQDINARIRDDLAGLDLEPATDRTAAAG